MISSCQRRSIQTRRVVGTSLIHSDIVASSQHSPNDTFNRRNYSAVIDSEAGMKVGTVIAVIEKSSRSLWEEGRCKCPEFDEFRRVSNRLIVMDKTLPFSLLLYV